MPNSKCVTALFDTCLLRESPGQELVWQSLDGSVPSLHGPRNSLVREVIRRVPKRWNQTQSDALFNIAKLARENRVRLFIYSEIELETLAGTLFPSRMISDCFDGMTIDRVEAAIERSKLFSMPMHEYSDKKARVAFVQWLCAIKPADLAAKPKLLAKFSPFERRNLESLNRLRTLCKNLAEEHFPDAFHLWTAEVNELDYFLTADKRFINALTKTSRVALVARPISPSDFVEELTRLENVPQ
jgi:hypothetical protein